MRDKKQELTTELYPQNLSHSGQMTKLLVELSFVPQISILKRQGKILSRKKIQKNQKRKKILGKNSKFEKNSVKIFKFLKKNPEKNLEFQILKKKIRKILNSEKKSGKNSTSKKNLGKYLGNNREFEKNSVINPSCNVCNGYLA